LSRDCSQRTTSEEACNVRQDCVEVINAESITLKDGTVLNITRDATQLIKKDSVQDIGNISGHSGTFIILGEGSGTGGGG